MFRKLIAVSLAMALAACGGAAKDQNAAVADSLSRDLELTPASGDAALKDAPVAQPQPAAAPAPAPKPKPKPQPKPLTLAAGTRWSAHLTDSLSSRRDKPGKVITAVVNEEVRGADGRVVIPAGATVQLTVQELKPAENKSQKDGKIVLAANSITIGGNVYPLAASVDSVRHRLQGRGVQAGDVAKVGAGAAVGAVAGKVIGGNTKGAVIGGVAGAAVGTAIAAETYDRDVIIWKGAKVSLTLMGDLTLQ